MHRELALPWPGRNLPPDKDVFNFYHSRLRTVIECAFGMMVARWGILWRPLRISLRRVLLLKCCMKLHNYFLERSENTLRNIDALTRVSTSGDLMIHLQDSCDTEFPLHRRRMDLERSSLRNLFTKELEESGLKRQNRGSTKHFTDCSCFFFFNFL